MENKENIICYLQTDELFLNKVPRYIGGLHAYTHLVSAEGKKQLAKGVPTTSGYYVGNSKSSQTVVNIKDYLLGTVTNCVSMYEAGLTLLQQLFTHMLKTVDDTEDRKHVYQNVCIICPHPQIEKLLKLPSDMVATEGLKFGKYEVTPDEIELLKATQALYRDWLATGSKVLFNADLAVEGGLGNKLVSKQSGLGKIETKPNGKKRVLFELMSKKEYEDPVTDFNKIVCGGRWYFNTGDGSEFYDDFNGYRAYNFGQVEPDKKYYGKLTPDVTFATLYKKTPIALLDKLFDYARKLIPNPNEYLSAGVLSNVVSKDVARIVDTFPGIKAGKDINIPFESAGKDEPTLIELIDPPVMSYQIRANIKKVHHLFDLFVKRDANNETGYTRFMDITNVVYQDETNKKGVVKRKLHDDFKQTTSVFRINVEHPKAVIPVGLILSIGYDLPDRNNFNSCIKEPVKVWLGYDVQNDRGVRYFCVVESDDWVYIQMSAVANLHVLSLKELGLTPPKVKEEK